MMVVLVFQLFPVLQFTQDKGIMVSAYNPLNNNSLSWGGSRRLIIISACCITRQSSSVSLTLDPFSSSSTWPSPIYPPQYPINSSPRLSRQWISFLSPVWILTHRLSCLATPARRARTDWPFETVTLLIQTVAFLLVPRSLLSCLWTCRVRSFLGQTNIPMAHSPTLNLQWLLNFPTNPVSRRLYPQ